MTSGLTKPTRAGRRLRRTTSPVRMRIAPPLPLTLTQKSLLPFGNEEAGNVSCNSISNPLSAGRKGHRRAHSDVTHRQGRKRWRRLLSSTLQASGRLFSNSTLTQKAIKVRHAPQRRLTSCPNLSRTIARGTNISPPIWQPTELQRLLSTYAVRSRAPSVVLRRHFEERIVLPTLVSVEPGPAPLPRAAPRLLPASRATGHSSSSSSSSPRHSTLLGTEAFKHDTSIPSRRRSESSGRSEPLVASPSTVLDLSPSLYACEGFERGTTPPHSPTPSSTCAFLTQRRAAQSTLSASFGPRAASTAASKLSPIRVLRDCRLDSSTLTLWLRSDESVADDDGWPVETHEDSVDITDEQVFFRQTSDLQLPSPRKSAFNTLRDHLEWLDRREVSWPSWSWQAELTASDQSTCSDPADRSTAASSMYDSPTDLILQHYIEASESSAEEQLCLRFPALPAGTGP